MISDNIKNFENDITKLMRTFNHNYMKNDLFSLVYLLDGPDLLTNIILNEKYYHFIGYYLQKILFWQWVRIHIFSFLRKIFFSISVADNVVFKFETKLRDRFQSSLAFFIWCIFTRTFSQRSVFSNRPKDDLNELYWPLENKELYSIFECS